MEFARNLLNEQRKRMVGGLMAYLESNVYPHLDEQQRVALRAKVLASVSAYHDVCLDMMKASVHDGTVRNDEALRMLTTIHATVKNLRED